VVFVLVYHLFGGPRQGPPRGLFLVIPALVLWAMSGRVARRLARPLNDLVRVADAIGAGKLSARADLSCAQVDEIGVLSRAINDMAARIERQLADQKQLLAEVSHELRTPLARIRLLVELGRSGSGGPAMLDEIEREAVEIDALVGELLASARLDFSALTKHPLDAADVARRALDRAGVPLERLRVEGTDLRLEADATLMARALANLLDNARKHGGPIAHLRVRASAPDVVAFDVEDRGAGFPPGEIERLTEALARGERPRRRRPTPNEGSTSPSPPAVPGATAEETSLGLGLALVARIARAHGGRLVLAAGEAGRGARVTLEVARGTAD
jgi:two-component system OmpR family sensor kinase